MSEVLKPQVVDKFFLKDRGWVYTTADMLDEEIEQYNDGTLIETDGTTLKIKGSVEVVKCLHYDERTGRSAKRMGFLAEEVQ
jgi:hypothetical protein